MQYGHNCCNLFQDSPKLSVEASMKEAAANASAADFIENLPEKYDTTAGDLGSKLSGGQVCSVK